MLCSAGLPCTVLPANGLQLTDKVAPGAESLTQCGYLIYLTVGGPRTLPTSQGEAKLEMLRKMKEFKRGIHQLHWENRKCEMEVSSTLLRVCAQ